jgi:N-methylhydantoinase B/oxoprolinase/acetone carboxylase alpha subunit
VAATEIGSRLLCGLVEENGESEVNAYMGFIRDNAEEAVRKMLYQFSVDNKMK